MPSSPRAKAPVVLDQPKTQITAPRLASTETIISKNLFDPERGASLTREAEANSRAVQRIRSMVLLGTAIIGNNQLAVLQDGGVAQPGGPPTASQSGGPLRLKRGEVFEGFTLSEIADKRVVFTRGPSRVELVLDYFRKVDSRPASAKPPPQVRPPSPVVPRVVPNLPRRQRLPGDAAAGSEPQPQEN